MLTIEKRENSAYHSGLIQSIVLLKSAVMEVKDFWDSERDGTNSDPFSRIEPSIRDVSG